MTNDTDNAQRQAQLQYESIVAMLAAVNCDYPRLEELREKASAGHYVAGRNMPGYMPDNPPEAFDDADDARNYLAGLMIETENPEVLLADAETLKGLDGIEENAEFGATLGEMHYFITYQTGLSDSKEQEELDELTAHAGDCEDEDDARQRIDEDPLCVEVASDWQSTGETLEASRFCILLCTGGPAVRIIGELDNGSPSRAWIEFQDWGTPWTRLFGPDQNVLIEYASNFFFGE